MPGEIWSSLPDFTARGGALQMGGRPFELKGVNWFGAEGPEQAPNGLWLHSLEWYLDFIAGAGFNAIRVPFALDNVRANAVPSADMITASPELAGLTVLDLLERLVDRAAAHGLLVLFDLHRLQVWPCPCCIIRPFALSTLPIEVSHLLQSMPLHRTQATRWPDDGLWYTAGVTLDDVKVGWDAVQARFCNRWNAMGADILNEPHGARWTDWAGVASQLGEFVLSKCARWLIFVEGVAHEGRGGRGEYFWGENLESAAAHPVRLSTPDKLVYSPHVYGPGDGSEDHHMPYFDRKDFPSNLEAIWERHFGYLTAAAPGQQPQHTVVVGEWGGIYVGRDQAWQDQFAGFLRRKRLSSFYWCLNPNSADTGGLLDAQWTNPEQAKLHLLDSLPSTALRPRLLGLPSFTCLGDDRGAQQFRCASGDECLLTQQACNGYAECADGSDEADVECGSVGSDGGGNGGVSKTQRPCLTAGAGPALPCVLPFRYNGFEYSRCTSVDAFARSERLGVGMCRRGLIPSLVRSLPRGQASDVSFDECVAACAAAPACAIVSYAAADGDGQRCSGYTEACDAQLDATRSAFVSYRVLKGGGAWCPTAVGAAGEFLGKEHAGACGPGCAPPVDGGAVDAAASGEGEASWMERHSWCGGPSDSRYHGAGHCAPFTPPPPQSPPSLPPPGAPPPPTFPPSAPPPWYQLDVDPLAAAVAGAIATAACCCACLWRCAAMLCAGRGAGSGGGGSGRRGAKRTHQAARRARRVSPEELEQLEEQRAMITAGERRAEREERRAVTLTGPPRAAACTRNGDGTPPRPPRPLFAGNRRAGRAGR